MNDERATFCLNRRIYQSNTFSLAGSTKTIDTIVIRPHSMSNIFVEFGFEHAIGGGVDDLGYIHPDHIFNVYVRVGQVSLAAGTNYPPLTADGGYIISYDNVLFDNFPAGTFKKTYESENHAAGLEAAPAGSPHQVTLSYDQPSSWSTKQLNSVMKSFWKALRSVRFNGKANLFEIHPQLALYFARADHVYPKEDTITNVRELLDLLFTEEMIPIFSHYTAVLEAGMDPHATRVKGNIRGRKLPFFGKLFDVWAEKSKVPTMAQTAKFYREFQLAYEYVQDYLKKDGNAMAREFLGINVMTIIGAFKQEGVRGLIGMVSDNNPRLRSSVPQKPAFDYFRSVLARAIRNFAKAKGLKYETEAQIANVNADFVENLFWHAPDPDTGQYIIPREAPKKPVTRKSSSYSNIPVLGWIETKGTGQQVYHDEMVFVIIEGARQAIARATRPVIVAGHEITPLTAKNKLAALDELKHLEEKLADMVKNPMKYNLLSKAKDSGYEVDPTHGDGEGSFLTDAVIKALYGEIAKPLKALFEGMPAVMKYFDYHMLVSYTKHREAQYFGAKLFGIMLDALWDPHAANVETYIWLARIAHEV
ncbi:MAG: hypothetical protein Q6373_005850, partial [Candidatus Sigynarchaeota archaeon]